MSEAPQPQEKDMIRTRIWQEEPEADNPFATRVARCHGYDVYGEMLGKAGWIDMLYLLFRGEAPTPLEAQLFENLAVALANPGPRDPAVHAAMCGGTGGSPAAASLMAALAVGAGQLCGGREILLAVEGWHTCGTDLDAWRKHLCTPPQDDKVSAWPKPEHPPGFDPHGVSTPLIVRQTLDCIVPLSPGVNLPWLAQQRTALEDIARLPLSLAGVAAAAYVDLSFSAVQAEMIHLLLRLPGAAAHALEQQEYGHKKFPFYEIEFDSPPRQADTETQI